MAAYSRPVRTVRRWKGHVNCPATPESGAPLANHPGWNTDLPRTRAGGMLTPCISV